MPVITLHTKPCTPHSLFGLMLVNTIGVMTESALFPNSVVPKILHFANLVYSWSLSVKFHLPLSFKEKQNKTRAILRWVFGTNRKDYFLLLHLSTEKHIKNNIWPCSLVVRVRVGPRMTVGGGGDWPFDNLTEVAVTWIFESITLKKVKWLTSWV